jgi:hypothetical protein
MLLLPVAKQESEFGPAKLYCHPDLEIACAITFSAAPYRNLTPTFMN